MCNKLQVMNSSKFQKIRVVLVNCNDMDETYHKEVWFVAADVCKIFGITNASRAVKNFDKFEKRKVDLHLRGGKINIISKLGIYKLYISRPRKNPLPDEVIEWVNNVCIPNAYDEYRSGDIEAYAEGDTDCLYDYLKSYGCTLSDIKAPCGTKTHNLHMLRHNVLADTWICAGLLDLFSHNTFMGHKTIYHDHTITIGRGKKARTHTTPAPVKIVSDDFTKKYCELLELYKSNGWCHTASRSYVCTGFLKYTKDTDCSCYQVKLLTYFTNKGEAGIFELMKANGILINIPIDGVVIKTTNKHRYIV